MVSPDRDRVEPRSAPFHPFILEGKVLTLKEMIEAPVAPAFANSPQFRSFPALGRDGSRDLELRSDPELGSSLLRDADGLEDAIAVALAESRRESMNETIEMFRGAGGRTSKSRAHWLSELGMGRRLRSENGESRVEAR